MGQDCFAGWRLSSSSVVVKKGDIEGIKKVQKEPQTKAPTI